jgi:CBS domain-containing protein
MIVKEVMTTNPEIVKTADTVTQAAAVMKNVNIGVVPVFEGEDAVGVLTDRDITVRVVAEGKDPGGLKVSDIMTRDVLACNENADVYETAKIMKQRQVRRLLVKNDQGKVVGMVSLGDLATKIDEKTSGEVLEEISKPARPER